MDSFTELQRITYGTRPIERDNPPSSTSTVARPTRPRVAVLVNLFQDPGAGGHVKCWERFAEAAGAFSDSVDVTVHFYGEKSGVHDVAENVRFRLWRPMFCTAWLPFLSAVPDHTDIAPFHPAVARDLTNYDVIHTTDGFFAFAQTAAWVARKHAIPLVHSVHTDTPRYANVYTRRILERLFGKSAAGRLLTETWQLPARLERSMDRKLRQHMSQAAFTLVSAMDSCGCSAEATGTSQTFRLRRGIDRETFAPDRCDRRHIEQRYGVPEDRFLIAFAGRLSRGKNLELFMRALDRNWMAAHNAHLFLAGEGEDRTTLQQHFGDFATCPGLLPQADLATVLASADVFVLPSLIEVSSNVVREALACGTGVLMSAECSASGEVVDGRTGRYLPGNDPAAWRDALAGLAGDADTTRRWGVAANAWARENLPSWRDVLREDLLPVWQCAAAHVAPTDCRGDASFPCSAAIS